MRPREAACELRKCARQETPHTHRRHTHSTRAMAFDPCAMLAWMADVGAPHPSASRPDEPAQSEQQAQQDRSKTLKRLQGPIARERASSILSGVSVICMGTIEPIRTSCVVTSDKILRLAATEDDYMDMMAVSEPRKGRAYTNLRHDMHLLEIAHVVEKNVARVNFPPGERGTEAYQEALAKRLRSKDADTKHAAEAIAKLDKRYPHRGKFLQARLVAQESLDPMTHHESAHVRLARRYGTAADVELFKAHEARGASGSWNRGRTIEDILRALQGKKRLWADEASARTLTKLSAECHAALARLESAKERAHADAREDTAAEREDEPAKRAKRAKTEPRKVGWKQCVLNAHFTLFEPLLSAKVRAQKKRDEKIQQDTRERAWVKRFGSSTRHYECELPGSSAARAALFDEADEPSPRIARAGHKK